MTFEEFKELKEGDRIVALDDTYFKTKGVYGTVIKRLSGEEVIINWDDNVNGWENKDYGIKDGHGEYVCSRKCTIIKKVLNNSYKLVISCEDGKHTNAKYYIDNKLVSESSTSRYEKYDDFDFKTAVGNCIDRMDFTDKTVTKGKGLIGKTIKKGQRVRIINVEPHREDDDFVCLDEYVGKEGSINYDDILEKNHFGASVTFDKKYMKAIDEENGHLCWRWDEIELID